MGACGQADNFFSCVSWVRVGRQRKFFSCVFSLLFLLVGMIMANISCRVSLWGGRRCRPEVWMACLCCLFWVGSRGRGVRVSHAHPCAVTQISWRLTKGVHFSMHVGLEGNKLSSQPRRLKRLFCSIFFLGGGRGRGVGGDERTALTNRLRTAPLDTWKEYGIFFSAVKSLFQKAESTHPHVPFPFTKRGLLGVLARPPRVLHHNAAHRDGPNCCVTYSYGIAR